MPLRHSPKKSKPSTTNTASPGSLSMDGSLSHSVSPPDKFVSQRIKTKRDDDVSTELISFKEDMRAMIASMMETQLTEIRKNNDALKEIQQTNRNIESAVEFLSAQNDEFRKKIEKLENQSKEDKKCIVILEDKIEELLKNGRKSNFEIKNAPKTKDETKNDLIDMVVCLSKSIECPISKTDIKDIYRVRGKKDSNQNSPIIVETSSVLLKNETLRKCKNFNIKNGGKLRAKHLGLRISEETPIYVSEHLTPKAARLFFLARELKRQKQYKYCWTSYGNVYLRMDDNAAVIQVTNEAHITQLSKTN